MRFYPERPRWRVAGGKGLRQRFIDFGVADRFAGVGLPFRIISVHNQFFNRPTVIRAPPIRVLLQAVQAAAQKAGGSFHLPCLRDPDRLRDR